jgi:hypothetical protein
MHPIHTFPPIFPRSSLMLPSYLRVRPSSGSHPFRFPEQNPVCISHRSHACYMPRLSYRPWIDHLNNMLWSVEVMKLHVMLSFPAPRPFLPFTPKYSPQTPSICFLFVCDTEHCRMIHFYLFYILCLFFFITNPTIINFQRYTNLSSRVSITW